MTKRKLFLKKTSCKQPFDRKKKKKQSTAQGSVAMSYIGIMVVKSHQEISESNEF